MLFPIQFLKTKQIQKIYFIYSVIVIFQKFHSLLLFSYQKPKTFLFPFTTLTPIQVKMANLNTGYLSTNRGIIKILQVVCGFITCSLLCANWYGGKSCFYDGRIGFASGLNFVIVIINIVLFFLNFLNAAVYRMERLYSVIGVILFIIAFGVMIWYIIEYEINRGQLIAATVFIGIQMVLFIWDYQILHGQAYN